MGDPDPLDVVGGEQLMASEAAVKGHALCIAGMGLEPVTQRAGAGAQIGGGLGKGFVWRAHSEQPSVMRAMTAMR